MTGPLYISDFNECKSDNGGCLQECYNTIGSFCCSETHLLDSQGNCEKKKGKGSLVYLGM